MRLEGKIALVTGAASGIGRAVAERFVAEGARVVMLDRDASLLTQIASRLAPASRARAIVAEVGEGWGVPDVLVACAAISTGAVIALTRSIALDYAPHGIRANCLVPGAIETPMLQASFARQPDPAAARARSRSRHPLDRFGSPAEVAAAALFLASDEASFTTGTLLPVDGGWLVG